jgi:hypothetical protein
MLTGLRAYQELCEGLGAQALGSGDSPFWPLRGA